MQQHDLIQGSPEWHAHRRAHFNASDAPAMMGCSPYKTRSQLLHEMHTGVAPEVDAATQRRFDDGHRFEAQARPLAEALVDDDLYPVTGTLGRLSASFDGLTMDEATAFEHKSLNDELRAAMVDGCTGTDLPLAYRVQMEQQCAVSGAERVLFVASKWRGEELIEERHCWYTPDLALRPAILDGWKQFEADLAAYVPPAGTTQKLVAEPVEALPAPVVIVTGTLALQDNFKLFETRLRDFLTTKLIREPKTDEDFVNLDAQIKAMKAAREALKSAEAQMLAQVQPIHQAKTTKEMLDKLLQENCSMAEGLLKDEKERRRAEIVTAGATQLRDHIAALNVRLGKPYMPSIPADFGGVVKGLKSLASMEDKVATELARCKIAANEAADRIQANLTHLREHAGQHSFLFADAGQLVLKATDDLAAVVTSRIAAHAQQEAERLERERVKIREEEAARISAEQALQAAATAPPPTPAPAPVPQVDSTLRGGYQRVWSASAAPATAPAPAPAGPPTLRLGQVGERLGFAVTAVFLSSLGIEPAGRDKSAVLFHECDFDTIGRAIVAHINEVLEQQAVQA